MESVRKKTVLFHIMDPALIEPILLGPLLIRVTESKDAEDPLSRRNPDDLLYILHPVLSRSYAEPYAAKSDLIRCKPCFLFLS